MRYTKDDIEFLRQLKISPEDGSILSDIQTVREPLMRPSVHQPTTFIIPAILARKIIKEYGELNWGTYQQYITGRQHNEKEDRR